MPTTITCPNCSNRFEADSAIAQASEEKYRAQLAAEKARMNEQWLSLKKTQDEEIRRQQEVVARERESIEAARRAQEAEIKKKVEEECSKTKASLEKEIREQTEHSFGAKLRFLEEEKSRKEEQLKESRHRELEFLRKEEEFLKREEALELEKQKAVTAERQRIAEEFKRGEEERFRLRDEEHQMRMKEYEMKLEQQKGLIEEMKRKAEQGSMQTQGEAQELALEELLRAAFPYDTVKEVGKGMRGADCILTVRNAFGQECGCIIFESKRTQAFGGDWIEKLKSDMLSCSAEVAVIVTQAFPKEMTQFGERQGVYICSFAEVRSLVTVLRSAILKLYEARKSQENKGDKMVMLYDYLTGAEFIGQWNAMRESFTAFRSMLQKERDDFEKAWKKKQKLLEVILNNSLQISGSVEGISGMESMNWSAIPESSGYLIE